MSIVVNGNDRIEMSQRERDLLKILETVRQGQRTQAEAARLVGLSIRHVRRLERRLEAEGDGALVHGLRGQPSNHRIDPDLRRRIRTAAVGRDGPASGKWCRWTLRSTTGWKGAAKGWSWYA